MVRNDRYEIKGKTPISRTTIHGWSSVLFGLLFAAAGIYIILISFNVIETPDNKFHVPRYMTAMFGGVFFMPGLFLVIHGLLSLNYRPAKYLVNASQWDNDYNWNHQQINDRSRPDLVKFFFSTLILILFLLPFHLFIFKFLGGSKISYFPKVLMIIFDLAVLIIIWTYFKKLFRYLKYGMSSLRFNQFPFFLGNNLDLTFIINKQISGTKHISATIQCIEEKYETRCSGDNKRSVVVCYHLYSESKGIEFPSNVDYGSLQIPIQFDLPSEEIYRTRLKERPPTYWELEIKAETDGIDLAKNFLLPVY